MISEIGSGFPGRHGRRTLKGPDYRAFTLIEILIVISIISLLAGMLVVASVRVIEKGRIRRTEAAVNLIADALENYRVEYREFPPISNAGIAAHPTLDTLDIVAVQDRAARGAVILEATGLLGSRIIPPLVEPHTLQKDPQGRYLDAWGNLIFIVFNGNTYPGGAPTPGPSPTQQRISLASPHDVSHTEEGGKNTVNHFDVFSLGGDGSALGMDNMLRNFYLAGNSYNSTIIGSWMRGR